MKKLTYTLNATWMLAILLGAASMQGMEKNLWLGQHWSLLYNTVKQPKPLFFAEKVNLAFEIQQYNRRNPLLQLPVEMLSHIFSYCFAQNVQQEASFINSIKNCMKLSSVCKNFLTYEKISCLLKQYDQTVKNKTLFNVGKSMNEMTYKCLRIPLLTLICAGADTNTTMIQDKYLLAHALQFDDEQMVKTLLQHNADPNITEGHCPLFFFIENADIVRLCINHGLKVRATPKNLALNVLWEVIRPSYSAELLEIYLNEGVDPKQLHPLDNSSLLHGLANTTDHIHDEVRFWKKSNLLITAVPRSMFNTLNAHGQTALDVAYESLETSPTPKPLQMLIETFSAFDCYTSKELAQKAPDFANLSFVALAQEKASTFIKTSADTSAGRSLKQIDQ